MVLDLSKEEIDFIVNLLKTVLPNLSVPLNQADQINKLKDSVLKKIEV